MDRRTEITRPLKLVLERQTRNSNATIGILFNPENQWEVITLENPWRNNGPDSSIPTGIYKCSRVNSPKFGNTFEVCEVSGRTHILFHAGNTEVDTLGCILLGMTRTSEIAIGRSREAFERFLNYTNGIDEFELEIMDEP